MITIIIVVIIMINTCFENALEMFSVEQKGTHMSPSKWHGRSGRVVNSVDDPMVTSR